MRNDNLRLFALVAWMLSAVWTSSNCSAVLGASKVIGSWEGEGNMSSPYTIDYDLTGGSCDQAAGSVNWCTTPGNGGPMTLDWINVNDVDYVGGVTHGDWALKVTYPPQWDGGPYLRLHGQEQLMGDTADFPYLLIDVTTFGPAVDPSGAPEGQGPYRQMFSIFNIPDTSGATASVFYDANFDSDIQHEIEIADFGVDSFTHTVVVDMTATSPVHDDGKNVMNVTADFYRTDHNDGTPIGNFLWQLVWPFQGRNYPATPTVSVVIDNVRFCADELSVCLTPSAGLPGDHNDDGNVDAADYVVWRKNPQLFGGAQGYDDWAANFGLSSPGSGASLGAVPEPGSALLLLAGMTGLSLTRRGRSRARS